MSIDRVIPKIIDVGLNDNDCVKEISFLGIRDVGKIVEERWLNLKVMNKLLFSAVRWRFRVLIDR